MNDDIEKCNLYYEKALAEKDIAIKSDNNIEKFLSAAKSYEKAVELIDKLIDVDLSKINFNVSCAALKEYYLYEANECLYAYNYKKGKFDASITFAKKAKAHIEDALKIIDQNFEKLNIETQNSLLIHKGNWTLSSLTVPLRLLEPLAKKAMDNGDYITALDTYRSMTDVQDKAHSYVSSSNLPEVYKRTEAANYVASKASTAMSLVGVFTLKSNKSEYHLQILEQLLIAYSFSKLGLITNPEQDRYKEGLDIIYKNIQNHLQLNKVEWFNYLTEFKDDNNLKTIMQKTNNQAYKNALAKNELENNNSKRFLLMGTFWLGIFLAIGYFVMHIASSNISWYRFIGVLFFVPLLFTILGAFILRSTNGLKEENFIKLMTLAFKINLQGLKVLGGKKDNEQNKPTEL